MPTDREAPIHIRRQAELDDRADRFDVLLLSDGGALVCWLERLPDGGAVRVQRIRPKGKRDEAITVAASGTARSNGFPQMARVGKQVAFAWTGARALTAALTLPEN